MKKILLILLTAALLLAGCGNRNSEAALILPKITYATAPAAVPPLSPAPTPAPTKMPVLSDADIPSEIHELSIMDEGYHANAVAGIGNTLLAAELDDPDYQLVLAHYRLTEAGTVELTDRTVLLQGPNEKDTYLSDIRGISAGPDGCYYVLTGEAPRKLLHIDLRTNDYTITENPDYSGKCRVLQYSDDGVLLDTVDIPALPADLTGVFSACDAGKLLIFGMETVPESEQRDEFDFNTVVSTSLFVLDFATGEYDTYRYGMDIVQSACPCGESAMVYMERISDAPDAGLFILDLHTGEFEKIVWPYAFGLADSTHIPYCFSDGSKIFVNNQLYYGIFDPVSLHFEPLLNSFPENAGTPIREYPEISDYPSFSSCCRVGAQTFIGAVMGSEALYTVSPAV